MLNKPFSGILSLFSISDEQAMWRVQTQDDHRAFAVVMDRWEDRIFRLCLRMIGNAHTAEDLTQEVFARIFEKRHDYQPAKLFSTWLWRIAMNRCYDELRRRHRRGESPLDDESGDATLSPTPLILEAPGPDLRTAQREEAEIVRDGLMQLPDIYRSVLVLRHYEGLKLREIAEVLDIPEGTVNSRMAEALAQLTRILEPQLGESQNSEPRPKRTADPKEILAL
jgi:RNA polymerase sigma-70 factor, ECF subfamily